MLKSCFTFFLALVLLQEALAQPNRLRLSSSDPQLQSAFEWAVETAHRYRGNASDAVGPWYEAALPSREAFCIRDVSHQCIAAAMLGFTAENRNMTGKFLQHISASKDWCSYWEMDRYNRPAPVDYQNDSAFWYNLNANFELIYAAERLYRWTGDQSYISDPAHKFFFARTLNDYIRTWQLDTASLFKRKPIAVQRTNYKPDDNYTGSRGLPSYVESVPGIRMSADLLAAIYQGYAAYSRILKLGGDWKKAEYYEAQASLYLDCIERYCYDMSNGSYRTYFTESGESGSGEGALFLLWFDAVKDPERKKKILHNLAALSLNVESRSYLARLCYLSGLPEYGRKYIIELSDPANKRRDYPEVSFGVIDGVVGGLMGIEADASTNTISTCFRGSGNPQMKLEQLSVLGSTVTVEMEGGIRSSLQHTGKSTLYWKAGFRGRHPYIMVNGKKQKAVIDKDRDGMDYSFVRVPVNPGKKITTELIEVIQLY